MQLIDRHKALIITFLITGIVVLSLFSIKLKQQGKLITESYFLIEPEPEITQEELQKFEDLTGPSTNKAFNEDQEYKEMMRNFKTVRPNDFKRTTEALEEAKLSEAEEDNSFEKSSANSKDYALKTEETKSYKKLQDELNKRLENKKQADEHAKSKSTLTYSLKGRTLTYYNNPRYLCEYGGTIVINIKVNGSGTVYEAYVNGSSNSDNQCLLNHALDYAKSVQFNTSEQSDQIGTITFLFKAKN